MSDAQKSECPAATGQNANQNNNTATVAPAEKIGNQYAMLRAKAALAGVTLFAIENDHGETVYIVSKWNLTRELDSLSAVENWLEKVTGVKA